MKVLCRPTWGRASRRRNRRRHSPRTTAARSPDIRSARSRRRQKGALVRRTPAALFRSRDGRRFVGDGPRHQQPRARTQVAARGRRALHAHNHSGRESRAPGHLDRRPLPQRGRRRHVPGIRSRASGAGWRPIRILSSASACTRSRVTPTRRAVYMQNHGGWADWTGPGGPRPDIGVLRSDNHGRTWRSIAKGLPTDFGFPIVVHPHDADTVYIMPLAGDALLPQRRARGVAQRERRRLVEPPRARAAEEAELLHHPARRDGHRSAGDTRAVLRHDHRSALDREGGGEKWDCLFESLPPIHDCQGGGRLSAVPYASSRTASE